MRKKHLFAGGTAGAVAATDDDKKAEQTVLADAAKRLGVDATELRSALSSAEQAQLDAAVKAGQLTRAQADEIAQHRRQEGTVLRLGGRHGGPGGRDGHGGGPGGHGGGRFLLADAAKAIGISEGSLETQLRGGKTLAAIAKAQDKTLAQVRSAVKAAATDRLDADLKAGRITRAQRDEEVGELDEEIARLGDGRFGDHGRGGGPGFDDHDGPGAPDQDRP